MELNSNDLDGIKRMASCAFTPRQIADAFGIEWDCFLNLMMDSSSPINQAYFTGLNSSELAVRESAFLLARNGSSPAQTFALKLFDETRKRLLKDGITSEEI